jgi:Tripartite tricarboxylate transporter family receptor
LLDLLPTLVDSSSRITPSSQAFLLAEQIARTQGTTIVVENRPGAGTVIGTDAASRAAPDAKCGKRQTCIDPLAGSYFCDLDITHRDRTGWLGRKDSNLCIRNRARLGLRLFLQDFRLGLEMPANAGRLRRAVSCLYLE